MFRAPALFLLVSAAGFGGPATYTVNPINLPCCYGLVFGVNSSGQVVTTNPVGSSQQAYIASPSVGSPVPLPSGWTSASGNAINDAGQVAGNGFNGSSQNQAFIGTVSGSTAIPYVAGSIYALGTAISSNGYVTGLTTPQLAFIGTASSSSLIPLVSGWTSSIGDGVNASGQVSGAVSNPTVFSGSNQLAFIGTTSGSAIIPQPGGYSNSEAFAINDSGQAAGNVWNGIVETNLRAFVGNTAGIALIPLPPGATTSNVGEQAINNSGAVVGNSDAGPWIWTPTGGTVPLSTLIPAGWTFDAFSISNGGIVMGLASFNSGPLQYVELVPAVTPPATPAPATWLLSLAGLGFVLLAGRRYRRL